MNAVLARELMADFAVRTGLEDGQTRPRRYLWTDAYAVCNFLGLGQTRLALCLVEQVHHVLGRHRDDDPRDGWISGLDDAEGERHPTGGGLRIGKELPERRPDEPAGEPRLDRQISEAAAMCAGISWTTDDPLGLGGLLNDVARLGFLVARRGVERRDLLHRLLEDSRTSLRRFADAPHPSLPAGHRLAFRELGLSIGLHAVEGLRRALGDELDDALAASLDALLAHRPLAGEIETFWTDPAHRRAPTWTGHRDINEVMLATSLAPEGWLALRGTP